MPDGTSRFSYKGQPIFHYMGCSTFSNFTVLPEIAVAKIREDAPFQTSCYVGCGVTTGVGAVVNTAKVRPGDNVVVFGLGGIGLNVIQGARMAGADRIVGVDINPDKEEWGRKFGMTDFVNPKERGTSSSISSQHDRRRGGLYVRLHRQHRRDAPGARMLPSRLGQSASSSAWPRRARKSPPARSSWSPAATGAARPSAGPRAAPTCPRSSTGT
jgi:hypothetical protein